MELRKGESGWLTLKSADGKMAGRIFPLPGADGNIEYLHVALHAAVRLNKWVGKS
jgi:hypothetical protein